MVAQRLYHQYVSRPGLATPAEVVRWLGAVQAQELPGALYAVGLRMADATEDAVERAIADRSIVRTWPMRGTIHFVPAEDAQWMLKLLARRTNQKATSIYRRAGLTDEVFARAGEALTRTLQGGRVLARKEMYPALEAAGIATSGDQRGLHLLGYWAREGLICLGPRQGKQATFTLLDEWVPNARQLEGDAALAELAQRYFTSHGPATAHDFAWWSGLTLTEARRGAAQVERSLQRDTIGNQTYWLTTPPAPFPAPTCDVHLLPQYDEFTVAYKDRAIARDPTFPDDSFLILGPVVVVDGRVTGVWKRTLAKDAVRLTITLYAPLGKRRRDELECAVERYGRFLGLPAAAEVRMAGD
jgi:winged helix DNA-binding protein